MFRPIKYFTLGFDGWLTDVDFKRMTEILLNDLDITPEVGFIGIFIPGKQIVVWKSTASMQGSKIINIKNPKIASVQ